MKKNNNRGSILVFVLVIFMVVMVLGMMLLTRTQYSQANAISQTEKQQAYYTARSLVDVTAKFLKDTSTRVQFINSINNIPSDKGIFLDNYNQEWEYQVTVKKDTPILDEATIIAEVKSKKSGVKKVLKGIINVKDGSFVNAFNSNNGLRIKSLKEITINQDISAIGERIIIKAIDRIELNNVKATYPIVLQAGGMEPTIKVQKIMSTATGVSVSAVNGTINIESIEAQQDVYIKAKTVNISGGIKTNGSIKIDADTITSGPLRAKNNVVLRKQDGIPYTDTSSFIIEKGNNSIITGADTSVILEAVPNIPIPISIHSDGDITVYSKDGSLNLNENGLFAQFIVWEGGLIKMKEKKLEPNQPYCFTTGLNTAGLYFGIKKDINFNGKINIGTPPKYNNDGSITAGVPGTDGKINSDNEIELTNSLLEKKGVDGKNKKYIFYVHPSVSQNSGEGYQYPTPTTFGRVVFINNTNITYLGNFQVSSAGEGAFLINGDTTNLQFGEPGYKFLRYEE